MGESAENILNRALPNMGWTPTADGDGYVSKEIPNRRKEDITDVCINMLGIMPTSTGSLQSANCRVKISRAQFQAIPKKALEEVIKISDQWMKTTELYESLNFNKFPTLHSAEVKTKIDRCFKDTGMSINEQIKDAIFKREREYARALEKRTMSGEEFIKNAFKEALALNKISCKFFDSIQAEIPDRFVAIKLFKGGKDGRVMAERRLESEQEGAFLFRESTTDPNKYISISIKMPNERVEHFSIRRKGEEFVFSFYSKDDYKEKFGIEKESFEVLNSPQPIRVIAEFLRRGGLEFNDGTVKKCLNDAL